MPTLRSQRALATLLVVIGAAATVGDARSAAESQTLSATANGAVRSGLVLSEVLFDPSPSQSPFVELLNVGAASVDLTGVALEIADRQWPLARANEPLASGARLLVRFDGGGRVEPGIVHMAPSVTLSAQSGALALIDERDETIDRVAWGTSDGAVISVADVDETPAQGRTIGRPPGANRPHDLTEWVEYAPAAASPGAANPLPAVQDLLPMSGEIVTGPTIALHWYPVVGAVTYRVQVAPEETFSAPVVDLTVAGTSAATSALAGGAYVWRVRALSADGTLAPFSAVSRIRVAAGTGIAGGGAMPGGGVILRVRSVVPPQQIDLVQPRHILPVSFLPQHKDTQMLQLENERKNDPHGWDRDHGDYDRGDPSDSHNCVLASAAMINHFHGGDLSQDRIAYEVRGPAGRDYADRINRDPNRAGLPSSFPPARVVDELRETRPGPEWDFNYGEGLNASQKLAALTFALGGLARYQRFFTRADLWRAITSELDAGRPLIGTRGSHAVAVVGYGVYQGQEVMVALDPIRGMVYRAVDQFPAREYGWFFGPTQPRGVRQEPAVTLDSDFDGVVDFDETERFFTDSGNRDTDRDGVWDKDDIASGVFDPTYGYAAHTASTKGRNFDGDRFATELDPDSDDGGCLDGVEDRDASGDRSMPETWNFDDTDDLCGEINGHIMWTVHQRLTIGAQVTESYSRMVVTVRLREDRPGRSGPLVDNGSRFRISGTSTITLALNGTCQPFGRQGGSGRGLFRPPDSEIGGNVSEEGLVVGAIGTIPQRATADWCLWTESGDVEMAATLPDCLGERVGTSRTYRFNCTTPPAEAAMAGLEIFEWSMTGIVSLAPRPPAP